MGFYKLYILCTMQIAYLQHYARFIVKLLSILAIKILNNIIVAVPIFLHCTVALSRVLESGPRSITQRRNCKEFMLLIRYDAKVWGSIPGRTLLNYCYYWYYRFCVYLEVNKFNGCLEKYFVKIMLILWR